MKTKIDKKAKKRSLSETSLSIKSNQKQKTITGPKKNPKKAKLVGLVQNGNSTMGNKVQILKKMYKQKEKPKIKQTNTGSLAEIKTEGTKLPIAKLNEESVGKKTKTKEKKLKNLQIKQAKHELRKKRRRSRNVRNGASITLSTEEIEAKIEEIRSREVLSKRAKKLLSVLNRKLRFEKSALDKSGKLNVIGKKGNKKNQQVGTFVKTESVSNKDKKDKIKIKKEHVEHESLKVKQEKDDQNDSNIMKTEDEDEDESDEDQIDTETEESMHDANEQLDDESEDEEDEEDEDTEDDEEDEDDETDENDEDEEANTSKVKKEDEKKPKTQAKQSLEHQKKNQYVLFVGNLPTDVTADELKQHFLTKVNTVSNVRIPIKSDTKTPRGFAFVEVTNSTDLEKGLSLHHTIIRKRRIIVKPNENKRTNVGKNFGFVKNFGIIKKKPQAFQKAKKLTSGNQGKKKPLKKEKQS